MFMMTFYIVVTQKQSAAMGVMETVWCGDGTECLGSGWGWIWGVRGPVWLATKSRSRADLYSAAVVGTRALWSAWQWIGSATS